MQRPLNQDAQIEVHFRERESSGDFEFIAVNALEIAFKSIDKDCRAHGSFAIGTSNKRAHFDLSMNTESQFADTNWEKVRPDCFQLIGRFRCEVPTQAEFTEMLRHLNPGSTVNDDSIKIIFVRIVIAEIESKNPLSSRQKLKISPSIQLGCSAEREMVLRKDGKPTSGRLQLENCVFGHNGAIEFGDQVEIEIAESCYPLKSGTAKFEQHEKVQKASDLRVIFVEVVFPLPVEPPVEEFLLKKALRSQGQRYKTNYVKNFLCIDCFELTQSKKALMTARIKSSSSD